MNTTSKTATTTTTTTSVAVRPTTVKSIAFLTMNHSGSYTIQHNIKCAR